MNQTEWVKTDFCPFLNGVLSIGGENTEHESALKYRTRYELLPQLMLAGMNNQTQQTPLNRTFHRFGLTRGEDNWI